MPIPIALCAVCGQRVCDHDDFQFAGFAPAYRGSSAGVRTGANLPAAASLNPPLAAGTSHFSVAHAAIANKNMEQDHA